MLTDIEIARSAKLKNITEISNQLGIDSSDVEQYGNYKAKININKNIDKKAGKVILVTAINPTPAGEGKTTTTIGLGDALNKIGKNAIISIREPSLGPVFGMKGGAAGGGYSQVVPMEDINLHFTGDLHAIGTANNLLCAMIDNHIKWGNELNIDASTITFRRAVDMNERQLRNITSGLGGKANGVPREDGFDITVASEVMAIFCLSTDIFDLKQKLGEIVIGYSYQGTPVTAKDLKANGAMTALLKDALKPNLVQTLEHTPTFIHGGPFANIAHGCNSVIATNLARTFGDYVVTEAGFGADLGAEKFINIKCRKTEITPSVVVLVATVRALKYNAGVEKNNLNLEDVQALEKGVNNLYKHAENITENFNLPIIVAINKFHSDTDNEINALIKLCADKNIEVSICENFAKGSDGALDLAEKVCKLTSGDAPKINYTYDVNESIEEKISKICTKIYGANGVIFEKKAINKIKKLNKNNLDKLPICMAKTQYSLTDDPTKLCRPTDFKVTIKDITVSAGAGFIVAITGDIMKMPGLPKRPSAFDIDIDENGEIVGLF